MEIYREDYQILGTLQGTHLESISKLNQHSVQSDSAIQPSNWSCGGHGLNRRGWGKYDEECSNGSTGKAGPILYEDKYHHNVVYSIGSKEEISVFHKERLSRRWSWQHEGIVSLLWFEYLCSVHIDLWYELYIGLSIFSVLNMQHRQQHCHLVTAAQVLSLPSAYWLIKILMMRNKKKLTSLIGMPLGNWQKRIQTCWFGGK